MKIKKSQRNSRFFFHRMGLIFFFLPLLILVLGIVLPDRGFSEKENRVLASAPGLKLNQLTSGGFEKQFETYENDQFPLRDLWITLKASADRLMGKVEENGVLLGKNGYLMEEFKSPVQTQYDSTVKAMTDFAQRHSELKQYALIAPNSVNILKDKLPAFAPVTDQNLWLDDLKDSLTAAGVTFIDVRATFQDHKMEDLYYHTDHHWTTLGAYYGYQALAAAMKLDTSKAPAMKSYAVTNSFNGTLSATSGYETDYNEPIYIYAPDDLKTAPQVVVNNVNEKKKTATLYDTSKLKEKDKYALFLGGNYPVLDIRTTADTTDRLLLVKDSYANSVIPFLTAYYREIIVVDPRYYYDDIREVMKKNKITSVLFLYNGNTFVQDNSISGVLQND